MLWQPFWVANMGTISFKPLQNGAVLCCKRKGTEMIKGLEVSNPFRTGRYCAAAATTTPTNTPAAFQTPSERGGIVLRVASETIPVWRTGMA